mgnify:CR=1 FL=1
MRVGLTNDDGVDAPGLAHLARHLHSLGHEVVISAPVRDMSGAGASTGADLRLIRGFEVRETTVAGLPAHAVGAPPAVCALLAVRGAYGPPVDVMVSGINPGANVGTSVLHSGTVGAVLTVGNFGVPGLAVSLDTSVETTDELWASAAHLASAVLERMRRHRVVAVASLNVPALPLAEIKGVRTTRLDATPGFRSTGVRTVQDNGDGSRLLTFTYAKMERVLDPASDVAALLDGYASLTWLNSVSAGDPPPGFADLDINLSLTGDEP